MRNEYIDFLAEDVKERYTKLRRLGNSRGGAIAQIKNTFESELQDDDDRFSVILGLVKALCQRKELTKEIAAEMKQEIQAVYQSEDLNSRASLLKETEGKLLDSSFYGGEAKYKKRIPYIPDWNIGDVFCHTLTHPAAKLYDIYGWSILLYKVGEHVDEFEQHRQLMYVSICPPGKEPCCSADIHALGFLQTMYSNGQPEYLAQITIRSKKDELSYGLAKLGCFLPILPPDDSTEENPFTARPLFGKLRKDDIWPSYERHICDLYGECSKRHRAKAKEISTYTSSENSGDAQTSATE